MGGVASGQVSTKKNADISSARARKYIPMRSFESTKEMVQLPNDENRAPTDNRVSQRNF
jgi:hypothetical protein